MKTAIYKRSLHTRRATPAAIDETPAQIEVTDGGAYLRIGDVEIAVTSADMDDDDKTHESLLRARAVVQALIDEAPHALDELNAALKQLGAACDECGGSKGEDHVTGFVPCPRCKGRGRINERLAAA